MPRGFRGVAKGAAWPLRRALFAKTVARESSPAPRPFGGASRIKAHNLQRRGKPAGSGRGCTTNPDRVQLEIS